MQLINLERIKRIHYLILNHSTGSPKELANKLDISESHLYNLLKIMKEYNAPIFFDRHKNTYKYKEPVKLYALFFSRK